MDVYHLVFIHCLKNLKEYIRQISLTYSLETRFILWYEETVFVREPYNGLLRVIFSPGPGFNALCPYLMMMMYLEAWIEREKVTWTWLTLDWDWVAPAPMSEDTRLRRAGRVARDPDSILCLLPSPAAGNIYHMSPTSGIRGRPQTSE